MVILPRDALRKGGTSGCLSPCSVHLYIASKQLKILSSLFCKMGSSLLWNV